jgi:hypothetical protein
LGRSPPFALGAEPLDVVTPEKAQATTRARTRNLSLLNEVADSVRADAENAPSRADGE